MPVKKAKQKQKVRVSQNVKVIVGDVRKKRAPRRPSQPQQKQGNKSGVTLNIINPYQQFLPPQLTPTQQAVQSQNQIIQQQAKDLKEVRESQQQIYNTLLAQQNERETPRNVVKPSIKMKPIKMSKIGVPPPYDGLRRVDKMLTGKQVIKPSVDWKSIIDEEPKAEQKLVQQEMSAPNIYQFVSPRPTAQQMRKEKGEQVRDSVASSWLQMARDNIAQRNYEEALSQQADNLVDDALAGALAELYDESDDSSSVASILTTPSYSSSDSSSSSSSQSVPSVSSSKSTIERAFVSQMNLPENASPPRPSHPSFLDQIKQGVQLKNAPPPEMKPTPISIFEEIKARGKLKKVGSQERTVTPVKTSNTMEEMMKRAMEKRRSNIAGDDDDEWGEEPSKAGGAGAGATPVKMYTEPSNPIQENVEKKKSNRGRKPLTPNTVATREEEERRLRNEWTMMEAEDKPRKGRKTLSFEEKQRRKREREYKKAFGDRDTEED